STSVQDTVIHVSPRGTESECKLHVHKDYELRPVTRTAATRNGTTVDLSYRVPYGAEEIWLVVRGYNSYDLPLSPTIYSGQSTISGEVTFSSVSGAKDQYVMLLSSPYRFGIDDFYTEKIGI
ncbi:MAG: hypothetical protein D6698_08965, partial [Gammaproteobacteria bacterium]